jgi:hypothetical protein
MLQLLESMKAVDSSMRLTMGGYIAASRGLPIGDCPTVLSKVERK